MLPPGTRFPSANTINKLWRIIQIPVDENHPCLRTQEDIRTYLKKAREITAERDKKVRNS
jgi:hypothetical protein